jgi:two-component system chemotaxis family response regulator WspR
MENEAALTIPEPKIDKRIKVLLVDDQAMIGEGIRRMLEDETDMEFHFCEDPSKAIETAVNVKATIILQDLVMPDIDGMTLVRFYRANQDTKDIPIIVLSSKEDPAVKSEAFGNGATDYLVKLPDKVELIARIRAHTKHYFMQLERDAAFFAIREMQKQLEQSNAELKRLSSLDGLTGIANRRHFDETLEKEWRRCMRENAELSLILIDIDFFKPFNDTYGHQGGDDTLQKVAKVLAETACRSSDLVARYGGEEFVVVLPSTDAKGVAALGEKLRAAVEKLAIPHEASQANTVVTISSGATTISPKDSVTIEEFIETADKALYQAKENGRNQIICNPYD